MTKAVAKKDVVEEEDKVLTEQDLMDMLVLLPTLPEPEKLDLLRKLEHYEKTKEIEDCKSDFLKFVLRMWPGFINGAHHKRMARAFERVADGTCKRLIINMPPRHTKSEFASYLLPAWFLGKFPSKKVIQTSHTAELAVGFGRKVRNLVDSEAYNAVFPELGLQTDSKAAGRWNTNKGGDYFAIGIGGAVTGKGADILIIDDPHSEQEAALSETNPEIYDKTYEWYTSGPRQRLQPGGAIVIVMCMTGDTNVLMADGTSTQLKNIRTGDIVATFDKGRLVNSKVNNWRSSGIDFIYTVQTQSGKILRANERHPFLVMNEGVLEWTRLRDLKSGMLLVALKDASVQQGHKQSQISVPLAKQKQVITKKTQTHPINLLGIMESGLVNNVNVVSQSLQKDYAAHAIVNKKSIQKPLSKQEKVESNIDTGLLWSSIKKWWINVITAVMYAGNILHQKIQERTGTESYVLTTATTQEKLEDCFATTATSQLDMVRQQAYLKELHRISDFTIDQIVSIIPSGKEEVFDVEVDRTENFIANGIVSHNTRWSKKDLTGQVIKSALQRSGEEWELIEFPAILPSGRSLWPEFWSITELEALKAELPHAKWMAQYMQDPTSEVSAIIKREWWKQWEKEDPPVCEFVIQSWDTAFLKSQRADYSACTTWGVFYKDDDTGRPQANIILLNAIKKRMEFPELKKQAMEQYKDWEPDSLIIEAKASGAPLVFELRAMGIPVQDFTPSKGNDKISRLNSISDIFASGRVWVPQTRWAEELVEEVASFPSGEHDDLVDSMSAAIIRFRKGGFLQLDTDYEEEVDSYRRTRQSKFYQI
jgi:predicted phage terminase large subunit-like protein